MVGVGGGGGGGWGGAGGEGRARHKLQALVYDILPSTTAVFGYATGSRKLSANEFFVDAQTVGSQFVTNYSDIGGGVLLNVLRCQWTY